MILAPNGSITIYSYNKSDGSYNRINIDKANINYTKAITFSDKTVSEGYTTRIIIDNEYEIATGDKLIIGTVETDISSVKDLKDFEVLTIVSINRNNILNSVKLGAK